MSLHSGIDGRIYDIISEFPGFNLGIVIDLLISFSASADHKRFAKISMI